MLKLMRLVFEAAVVFFYYGVVYVEYTFPDTNKKVPVGHVM